MLVEMLRDVQPVLAELVFVTGFDGEFIENTEQSLGFRSGMRVVTFTLLVSVSRQPL